MKTCRKDFQGRKSTTVLKLLCRNIAAGRFPLLQHAGSGI